MLGHADDRAEFAATQYSEVSWITGKIDEVVGNRNRSLEIGCGYGRLTPWIADCFEKHSAIDPNSDAINRAEKLYPEIDIRTSKADDLPYDDNEFDFILSWTVLMHIPPESINDTCQELCRVLKDDGVIIALESNSGEGGANIWSREYQEYADLLDQQIDSIASKRPPTLPGGEVAIFR